MGPAWCAPLVLIVCIGATVATLPEVDGLSCLPPEGREVGTMRLEPLASGGEVVEVPFWTESGCAYAVAAVPAALHGDRLVFMEWPETGGGGTIKAIDLATDARYQASVAARHGAELALGAPYVYVLDPEHEETRHLTGYPMLSDDDDLPRRILRIEDDAQVHLGMHTLHRFDVSVDPPRLNVVDLARWGTLIDDRPLPVREGAHWRLLAGNAAWTVLEERDRSVASYERVDREGRVWAYHHATGRVHEILVPAEPGTDDHHGSAYSAWGFGVDGDRLHYMVWQNSLPWSPMHLEALTLPDGPATKVFEGRGLHRADVDDGRLILFLDSDNETIPGWDQVEPYRYTVPDERMLPGPAVVLFAAFVLAAAGVHRRLS